MWHQADRTAKQTRDILMVAEFGRPLPSSTASARVHELTIVLLKTSCVSIGWQHPNCTSAFSTFALVFANEIRWCIVSELRHSSCVLPCTKENTGLVRQAHYTGQQSRPVARKALCDGIRQLHDLQNIRLASGGDFLIRHWTSA